MVAVGPAILEQVAQFRGQRYFGRQTGLKWSRARIPLLRWTVPT